MFTLQAVEQLSASLDEPSWMLEFRRSAYQVYQSLPMPTTSDEAWRRTDIRPLRLEAIGPSLNGGGRATAKVSPLLGRDAAGTLMQVDGDTVSLELSASSRAAGVLFTDMSVAVREYQELVQPLFMTQAVRPVDGKFAALHAAFWRGGTFLYVPAGVRLEQPLQSMLWGSEGKTFTHTLVVLEQGARAILVNQFASEGGTGQALHNGAVELILGDDANLELVTLQEWGRDVWQFTHERALLGAGAELNWATGSLGGRLLKSFQTVELNGAGASALVSGVFFAHGKQHFDHDTQQNHNMPDTASDLLYKGAVQGRGRSVWQGMIKVVPNAQRSNGYQANRNLLLDKSARADSIPGLEIEADDVRCTHGATAGQVDHDQVFYLMSRGLPRAEAVRLVVGGFFAPALDRVPLKAARERLHAGIDERL